MATQDHNEGIRLQAERVVTAYKELRADANSANFQSGDFPVGLFAELIQQIKLLEGWLAPAEDRLADLKARAAARGYELLRDDSGDKDRFYALDVKDRFLAAEPMTLAGVAEWLDSAEQDDREAELRTAVRESLDEVSDDELAHDHSPIDRARDNAQTTVYDVRFLVEAALTLNTNGDDDGPLEQVLEAAKEKLVALGEDLDSVNFGKHAA